MSRPNPGGAFEEAVLRSLPNTSAVWRRKNPTPPRPAPVAELCGEIGRRARESERTAAAMQRLLEAEASRAEAEDAMAEPPPWAVMLADLQRQLLGDAAIPAWVDSAQALGSQFTPSAGVDIMATAPVKNWGRIDPGIVQNQAVNESSCRPLLAFAFELKSTKEQSLPFDALRKPQEQELVRCAAGGHVAGLLIEWRHEPARCDFVPIERWRNAREALTRKSLPAADVERFGGVPVALDQDRGRVRPYWKMSEFMRRFGAEV